MSIHIDLFSISLVFNVINFEFFILNLLTQPFMIAVHESHLFIYTGISLLVIVVCQ